MSRRRDPREKGCTRWMPAFVLLSFGIVLSVGSQHMKPLGIHVLSNFGEPWRWEFHFAATGAVCSLLAILTPWQRLVHPLTLLGGALLFVTWITLMGSSDTPIFTLMTSAPFLAFEAALALHVVHSPFDLLAHDRGTRKTAS